MLQEYKQQSKGLAVQENLKMLVSDTKHEDNIKVDDAEASTPLLVNLFYSRYWKDYAVKLSRVLSSFLLVSEDISSHHVQLSAGKTTLPVSSVYGELSVKWVMRVLLTVFPCIEACSNQNELPSYLR